MANLFIGVGGVGELVISKCVNNPDGIKFRMVQILHAQSSGWSKVPDGALPLFIGGGDRLGGEGVQFKVRSEELEETMRHIFCTPSPAELVPSPYKQGESAVRSIIPSLE